MFGTALLTSCLAGIYSAVVPTTKARLNFENAVRGELLREETTPAPAPHLSIEQMIEQGTRQELSQAMEKNSIAHTQVQNTDKHYHSGDQDSKTSQVVKDILERGKPINFLDQYNLQKQESKQTSTAK
jgi:hypothetical protein